MSLRNLVEIYQFIWSLESHAQQRLAWDDAAEMRVARRRAEELAAARMQAMLDANPSGQLGDSQLNEIDKLKDSGLL